jgi:hypothetical protein
VYENQQWCFLRVKTVIGERCFTWVYENQQWCFLRVKTVIGERCFTWVYENQQCFFACVKTVIGERCFTWVCENQQWCFLRVWKQSLVKDASRECEISAVFFACVNSHQCEMLHVSVITADSRSGLSSEHQKLALTSSCVSVRKNEWVSPPETEWIGAEWSLEFEFPLKTAWHGIYHSDAWRFIDVGQKHTRIE